MKTKAFRRSGSALCMGSILFLLHFASQAAELSTYWTQEFDALVTQIAEYDKNGNRIRENNRHTVVDTNVLILAGERTPSQVALRRASALLEWLVTESSADTLNKLRARLDGLAPSIVSETQANQQSFFDVCRVRREIAFQNPLLDFDTLLFNGYIGNYRIIPNNDWAHASQQDAKAGIYAVSNFKSANPIVTDLLENAIVQKGRYQGKKLTNSEWGGNCAYNSFALDFDADRIVFAWAEDCRKKSGGWGTLSNRTAQTTFHLFQMNIDGSNLIQLTDSDSLNDYHPCWLPNGRIAFISERRYAGVRCGNEGVGGPNPIGTLYSVKDDGSDLICLSWHETSELYPSVNNDGNIVYTRWDYIDRDFNAAHHMWICGADGTDPRAPHGNYPLPVYREQHSSERCADGHRSYRPWAEQAIKAIPNSSRYMAVETGHHTSPCGQILLIDTRIPDDYEMSQIKTFFPKECYQRDHYNAPDWCPSQEPEKYGMFEPYPLSEDFYVAGQTDRVVLGDRFGNVVTLYAASFFTDVPVRYPTPLRARATPPQKTINTWQGERRKDAPKATISVMNVYESDFDWPEGVVEERQVKQLRIVQLIPQPWSSYVWRDPWRGYGMGSIVRCVLGSAPVEDDGSAYFEAPVEREIYFQAIDAEGKAIQSMRSGTYVHPGEHLSCLGCHEDKWKAVGVPSPPKALQRPASVLQQPAHGANPINYYQLVKPIFDSKCAPCHTSEGKGISFDYWRPNEKGYGYTRWGKRPFYTDQVQGDLEKFVFYFHATQPGELCSDHGGSRTIAGKFGARASKLLNHLTPAHHNVQLTDEELRRIYLWLDCGSLELSTYQQDWDLINKIRAGETVWPELDVDPSNPQGLQQEYVGIATHPRFQDSPHAAGMADNAYIAFKMIGNVLEIVNKGDRAGDFALMTLSGRTVCVARIQAKTDKLLRLDRNAAAGAYVARFFDGKNQVLRKIAVH